MAPTCGPAQSAAQRGRKGALQLGRRGRSWADYGKGGPRGTDGTAWRGEAATGAGRVKDSGPQKMGRPRRGKSRPRMNRPRGWTGPATGPTGRNRGKGGKILFFFFSNLQTNFKMQIQINSKSDFKPHSTKIICSSMNAQPRC